MNYTSNFMPKSLWLLVTSRCSMTLVKVAHCLFCNIISQTWNYFNFQSSCCLKDLNFYTSNKKEKETDNYKLIDWHWRFFHSTLSRLAVKTSRNQNEKIKGSKVVFSPFKITFYQTLKKSLSTVSGQIRREKLMYTEKVRNLGEGQHGMQREETYCK